MKRLGIALILTCVLSVSVFAGDIPTIGKASTAPASGETQTPPGETNSPPGETHTPPGDTQAPGMLETILLTILTWSR
jgi:hypothetical protein